jgi:hypothetical protein
MKAIITLIIAAIGISTVTADVYVNSYTKKNGTYVKGHYRSNPDVNFYNNWSTKGNVNPYTGSYGTRVSKPRSYGNSFKAPSTTLSIPSLNTDRSYPTYTLPKVSSGYSSFPDTSSFSYPSLNTDRSYPTYTLPKVSSGHSSFPKTSSFSYPSLNTYSSPTYNW